MFIWILFFNPSPSGLDSLCAPFLYLNFNNEGKLIYQLNNCAAYYSKIFYSNMEGFCFYCKYLACFLGDSINICEIICCIILEDVKNLLLESFCCDWAVTRDLERLWLIILKKFIYFRNHFYEHRRKFWLL